MLLLLSCVTSHIKLPEPAIGATPACCIPTLLVASVVEVDNEDPAVAAALLRLEDFGQTLPSRLEPWLRTQGYALVSDPERSAAAKDLTLAPLLKVGDLVPGSGIYVHPAGVAQRVAADTIGPLEPAIRDIVAALDSPASPESFAWITVRVHTQTTGLMRFAPRVRVGVVVADEQAEVQLRAWSDGVGETTPFAMVPTPESLGLGLDAALERLAITPAEPL